MRQHDRISVPYYSLKANITREADIMPKAYHPFRQERISLQKGTCFRKCLFAGAGDGTFPRAEKQSTGLFFAASLPPFSSPISQYDHTKNGSPGQAGRSIFWCGRWDLNPHVYGWTQAPQACLSTYSSTPASGAFWTLDYYIPHEGKSQEFFSNVFNYRETGAYMARQPSRASKKRARVPGPTWEPVTGS